MALDGTYPGLQATLADWLNRDDLAAQIPDFVAMAESAMVAIDPGTGEKLRVQNMVVTATAPFSAEFQALPADYLDFIDLTLPDGRPVELMTTQRIAGQKWQTPNLSSALEPIACAVVGSQLQLFPAPAAPVQLVMTYYARLPALASAGTNWMLKGYPTVYVYGTLLQAAPFLRDDERVAGWAALYKAAMQTVKAGDPERARSKLRVDVSLRHRGHRFNVNRGY